MKLEYDNELQELKSKMEEEMGSMAKQQSEDPRPLKAQINNLKADVKALNLELNQTKTKYTETHNKFEMNEKKNDNLIAELEKYKSGIKDFKDIVVLCEKEDKNEKTSNSRL